MLHRIVHILALFALPAWLAAQVASDDTLKVRTASKHYKLVSLGEIWAGVSEPANQQVYGTGTSIDSEADWTYDPTTNATTLVTGYHHLDRSILHIYNASTGGANTDGFLAQTSGLTAILTNQEAGPLTLSTSNTERARIAADGSTGIGSASPNTKLHVNSQTAHTAAILRLQNDNVSGVRVFTTTATPEAAITGDPGDIAIDTAGASIYIKEAGTGNDVSGWVELASKKLATITGINSKTTGTTNLFTVPTGKSAVITAVIIRVTASTSITVPCTAGVGIATGEDDIFDSEELTGITATGKSWIFNALGTIATGAAGNIVKLGIDTAATGTSQTLAVDVFGYIF